MQSNNAMQGAGRWAQASPANQPERANCGTEALLADFLRTRQLFISFCQPLHTEDYGLQAVAETSPPKWHLAHTTWFFETFILKPFAAQFQPWHPQYEYLFNSYYNGIGQQFPRAQRGLLSRPSVAEVLEYRKAVDEQICQLLSDREHPHRTEIQSRVELGIHHEQQHQELFFTDIKFSFSHNPLYPALASLLEAKGETAAELEWLSYDGGLTSVGCGDEQFCFDNETPRHPVYVQPFQLASRLATNQEFLNFIEDGGYHRPELWLADGWAQVQSQHWLHPLYWQRRDHEWFEYTLHGLQPLHLHRPVSHLSAYEADAFARWSDARLPTEFEWESAAQHLPVAGQFVEDGEYHPRATAEPGLQQMFGGLWEWTSSAYSPYPGFQPADGAIGEYNGKFMCNQLVLRGGSCVSRKEHLRASYRNFFYPPDRWQFTGVRLARN